MHTFLKMAPYSGNGPVEYVVGQWLATGDTRGCSFSKMFQVENLMQAINAVNVLNGGQLDADFKVVKEY
jgi:hypothetical protein